MSRHQILSSCLLVGMLAAYWFLLARGQLTEIRGVQGEIRDLRQTLTACEGETALLEQAQTDVDEVSDWLERVQTLYEVDGTTPDFLLEVANVLRACGLTPRETSPSPIRELEPLTQQSIRVVVHGRLDEVFEFLRRIEESRPYCRVTDLRIEPLPVSGEVQADLTMLRLWRES
jgi:Tfp pilus assembly protein PilO